MGKILKFEFYNRSALEVAPQLLGKTLCVLNGNEKIIRRPIFEVEAYEGFEDKASHAHKGMTPRNAIMFGKSGYIYVYLCYGVHWMLNIVTHGEGIPSAVLIRAVGPWDGPGKLTKNLFINKKHNGLSLGKKSGLWIEDSRKELSPGKIKTGPRIGVSYAGPVWSQMPWRFFLDRKDHR